MEEDFLDLGFVDQSLLNEFQDIKEEPADNQEENIEKNDEQPSNKEELSKEEIKDPEKKEVVENPDNKQETGSPNISSSIAEALVDEGVLQTLSKERLAEIKTTEDLIEAFKEDLGNQLTAEQKRVSDALTYGVEPTRIQQYEQWIKTLDNVTDELIEGEDEQNENYRKNLIYRDYLNKGFEESDAAEMVNRSVESGKDIDDAKKALSSLKKYYQKAYTDEVNEAKKEYDKHVASQKKQLEELKSSIIDDKENFYEQFELPKTSRQKVFDVVAKASVVDGDKKITPLQAFIKNDPNKANKIIGTLYVLTDGFTKFEGIMKGTVKKQVRKSVENLERALNQTKPLDGSMNFKSGIGEDGSNLKIIDFDFGN
jgi:hypothetical protein